MGKKILIVDDEMLILDVIKESLEMEGYEPFIALDGNEGLRQFFQHRPNLVITDAKMSIIDGSKFSRIIRQNCNTPIIMLTGIGHISQHISIGDNVNVVLPKPFKIKDLLTQVKSLLIQ